MKRYRIIRPRRFYTFLSILVLLLAVLLSVLAGALHGEQAFGIEEETVHPIYVKSGDTLWNLAAPIARQKKQDVREVVYRIAEQNDLVDFQLYPGQELTLPLTWSR